MQLALIDLRPGGGKKPFSGQQRLFAAFSPGPENSKRPTPLRVRRRRTKAIVAFVVIVLIAVAAYCVHLMSYLPQFSISTIFVTGNRQLTPQLVDRYVDTVLNDGSYHILSRANMFLYPRDVIEKAVVGFFPRVKSAHVSRASMLATAITVTIEEREAYAKWCNQAGCYLMDSDGFVFGRAATDAPTSPYVFSGGLAEGRSPIGQTFASNHLTGLVALLDLLAQAGYQPQGANIVNDQDFSVMLGQGFTVKASFGEDPTDLAHNLQLILSSDALKGKIADLEYVDLRFGNRVYYKLVNSEQATVDGGE